MSTHPPLVFTPLGIIAGIVSAYCWASCVFTGRHWRKFSTAYSASEKPSGREFAKVCGWFGSSWFGHKYRRLDVVLSVEGIYVEARIRFHGKHPPLLVPWRCVSSVEESDEFILVPFVEVTVLHQGCRFTLHLPGDALERVRQYLPSTDLGPTETATVRPKQSHP